MPMNFGNPASQNPGFVLWDGTASAAIDLRHHIQFGFTFEIVQDLANDTVFNAMSAPASDADPCVAGTFEPVEEVLTCAANWGAVPGPQASILLPAGTTAGSHCIATLPCKPDAFIALAAAGGDTGSVRAVITLHGPK
jgi:hypothetical protein